MVQWWRYPMTDTSSTKPWAGFLPSLAMAGSNSMKAVILTVRLQEKEKCLLLKSNNVRASAIKLVPTDKPLTDFSKKEEAPKEKSAGPIKKMSYKDQREYDTIGDEIAALEEKIEKVDADMAACATDFTRLQELSDEKEKMEAKLEERMERWMELSELAEEIERNKG